MSDGDGRVALGRALVAKLFAGSGSGGSALPARFEAYSMGHLFGDVWQDPGLPLEERSMITCAVLVALNRTDQLRMHIVGARNLGVSRAKFEAMITHVAHYAGWPCGASAFEALQAAWPQDG